jgi:hypothetical protein
VESPILVIDGGELIVFRSVADAEGGTEGYDIEGYRYLDTEGTVLELPLMATASARRLVPLVDRRSCVPGSMPTAASAGGRGSRPPNDPRRLAALLIDRQRAQVWPRWPKWLHRLVHRSSQDAHVEGWHHRPHG